MHPALIVGSALVLIGSILATANLIFVSLPQILVIAGLCLILPGALIIYFKDLKEFQGLAEKKK